MQVMLALLMALALEPGADPSSMDLLQGARSAMALGNYEQAITQLNDAYQAKFGFPFIVAVRGHTRESILAAMDSRLQRSVEEERAEALRQIERIAGFRLADLLRA